MMGEKWGEEKEIDIRISFFYGAQKKKIMVEEK